ncbi:MAG: SRPBCC family protein [Arenibacterium sp.]
MQFAAKEDIEAPIDAVFAMLSEYETFERSAIRRGIEVMRIGEHDRIEVGMGWNTRFVMRGKQRSLRLELTQYDPSSTMRFEATSASINATMLVDLLSLSQKRTRLGLVLDLKPQTLSARLLAQSLKLARANLTRRYKLRVAEYAKGLEDRYQRSA